MVKLPHSSSPLLQVGNSCFGRISDSKSPENASWTQPDQVTRRGKRDYKNYLQQGGLFVLDPSGQTAFLPEVQGR